MPNNLSTASSGDADDRPAAGSSSGGASLGPRGALAPLANENSHYVNSKMATVYYCSKRVAPPHLSKIQGQAPPLGTKWVFKNKQGEDGMVVRNKARLVAQGYS